MTMNIERLKRTSSFLSVGSLIIAVALIIALVAVIAVGIAILVNDGIMNMIADEIAPETFVRKDVYLIMAAVGMCVPLIALIFFFLYKLFGNFSSSHSPFSVENVKILKMVSCIMLILAVVSVAAEALIVFNSSWDVSTMQMGSGLTLILGALLIYFMAHIFEYGAALQRESDETL